MLSAETSDMGTFLFGLKFARFEIPGEKKKKKKKKERKKHRGVNIYFPDVILSVCNELPTFRKYRNAFIFMLRSLVLISIDQAKHRHMPGDLDRQMGS